MSPVITNCWRKAVTSRLKGEHVLMHRASSWGEAYSHHPQIMSHKERLWVTWSLGHLHEDTPGQRMVYSTSDDGGATWTAPATLVAAQDGEHAPTCVTSLGMRAAGDTLVAYYASFEFTLDGLKKYVEFGANSRAIPGVRCLQSTYTGIVVSEDGGKTWTGPVATIPGVVPNLSPVGISSGRLIMPAHRMHPYTDDPKGIHGWRIARLPGVLADYYDGSEIRVQTDWSYLGICEGSVYEMPGNVLRMMARTCKGYLAVSDSHDGGETWSSPRPTQFTDCGARFQFGRLPDGRYFALSCPDPNIPESCLRRTPLVLATSEDGNTFSRHYILGDEPDRPLHFPGGYKHGRYGYPYSHVLGDDLVVVNSVAKEDIEFHRFRLADLV